MKKLGVISLAVLVLVLAGWHIGARIVHAHDPVAADTNDTAAQGPAEAANVALPLILSEPAQTEPPGQPDPPDAPDDPAPPDTDPPAPPDDVPEPEDPGEPPAPPEVPEAPADPGIPVEPEPVSTPGGSGGQAGAALVVVTHLPRPSISVEPGGTLESVITIRNIGNADASHVVVTMPYDPGMLTVVTARFELDDEDDETYVSANDPGRLVIQTDSLGKGEKIVATIELLVDSSVAAGTPLLGRLEVAGSGIDGDRDHTNLPMVVAGSSSQDTSIFALETPDASKPAGSTYTFASGVFHPYELVTFWYHTPDGRDIEVGTVEANAAGEVAVAFTSGSRMAAGSYTMAANGNWSSIQAAAAFVVE